MFLTKSLSAKAQAPIAMMINPKIQKRKLKKKTKYLAHVKSHILKSFVETDGIEMSQ